MHKMIITLSLLCLLSALSVIWLRHENRQSFAQLQQLYETRDEMYIERRRLMIERVAVSRTNRLTPEVTSTLELHNPDFLYVLHVPSPTADTPRFISAKSYCSARYALGLPC